ncbi:glutathione peroxidase-type tryparedoxin peroxidase [Angomonas deanei]|nr:glutathione peroxidase-type tryparedoxin peroxidase [Angomonas deanei]|eukprot:EPY40196.1 glutathione peroxidase-type tryparedoxin peroxidase [Angomonas deanei]
MGHPLLIMNVASLCGLTKSGYQAAAELYNTYHKEGFTVLAFPCNQFGAQEPGSEKDVAEMVCTRFKADFPIMEKVEVNGSGAHPLFLYLQEAKPGLLGTKAIKWNFTSFLIDGKGIPVARYSPGTGASTIEKDLKPLLKASNTTSKL